MKIIAVIFIYLACSLSANAQNLFGDPRCDEWIKMEAQPRLVWLNALLAPMNMAYLTRVKTADDQYARLASLDPAIAAVDQYCLQNPEQQAAIAAIAFLNSLYKPQ